FSFFQSGTRETRGLQATSLPRCDGSAEWIRGDERRRAFTRRLFADDLDHDLARARPRVELEEHDLLPRAGDEGAVDERHGERRPEHRGAHVARSVVVAPAEVMAIVAVAGREHLEHALEIGDRARLELD